MATLKRVMALLRFSWIQNGIKRIILLMVLSGLLLLTEGILGTDGSNTFVTRRVVFRLPIPAKLAGKLGITGSPQIRKIIISGFFSGWNPDDDFYRMRKTGDNTWERILPVLPGDTQYKFVVYIKNRKKPVWIHNFRSQLRKDDSYGGFNSLIRVPKAGELYFLLSTLFKILLFAVLILIVLEPLFLLILHSGMPFRFKLLILLLGVVVISNIINIVYNTREAKTLVRETVVESCNLLHLALLGNNIRFREMTRNRVRIREALTRIFDRALTRVEKNAKDNRQITLSDIALFNPRGELIVLVNRRQNRDLQRSRAVKYGFTDIRTYFMKGLLHPLRARMEKRDVFETVFISPPAHLLKYETDRTRDAISTVGFKIFLHPVFRRGQLLAYYAGMIQTKMFGSELNRILKFNLFLLGAVVFFAVMLLLTLGKVVTRYLGELTGLTGRLIEGDFSASPIIRSGDEFEKLSKNFNSMRLTLRENIRKIEESNKLLQMEAYLDNLTCLPNRRKLAVELDQIPCNAMMIVNIDSFRGINDFFGNDVGDFIIKEMAGRLLSHLEGERTGIYKLEADEFVITIHQAVNRTELDQLAGRFCDTVMEEPYRYLQNEIYISVTAGIVLNTSGDVHKELLIKAGLALKAAKRLQLRRMVYSSDMDAVRMYEYNVRWTKKIKRAIEQDRIIPFYQPIVETKTGRITKYECLVRMVDDDNGKSVISPENFLPVAREARSYRFISRIMLEKTFKKFADLDQGFSVNLSVEDILDRKTCEMIDRLLMRNPSAASRCIFELVETADFEVYDPIVEFINRVHETGAKIAIDDFGTGYSNFSHIMSLPVDFIKIDGSLIRDLDVKSDVKKIVRTINGFAHKMGIATVAEYVHSRKVYEECQAIGVDYCQGFYFGKPEGDLAK